MLRFKIESLTNVNVNLSVGLNGLLRELCDCIAEVVIYYHILNPFYFGKKSNKRRIKTIYRVGNAAKSGKSNHFRKSL